MEEIRAVIKFYDEQGWDWLIVVGYLTDKNPTFWPPRSK